MDYLTKTKKLPISIIVTSTLVALLADVKVINLIFASKDADNSEVIGIMGGLYPAVFLSIVFVVLVSGRLILHYSKSLIFLVVYICLFYYYTKNLIGDPWTKFTVLLAYVLGSVVTPSITKVDAKIFLRGVMVFPSIGIFRIENIFAPVKDWADSISMHTSYSFLIPIVATIVYFCFYLRDDKGVTKIIMIGFSLINGVFLWKIFLHGSRGPLLSIVLLIVFLLVVKKNRNSLGVSFSGGKFSFLLMVLLIFLASYVFFFQTIVDLLAGLGIQSHALDKILLLYEEGDISNGRLELNTITINGIIENPFWGNGFDRFNANTGMLYPHNFLLQLLYDGGVIYFFVVLTPIVMGLVRLFKKCNYGEFAVLVCLMFSSVPGAMFSNNLYSSNLLWMFFGYTLSKSFVYTPKLSR